MQKWGKGDGVPYLVPRLRKGRGHKGRERLRGGQQQREEDPWRGRGWGE